ncbi:AbrB family transcriptional regulator [Anaeromicrobium sediminis]|uniref:AbrB family transcriptional regulator n=1 Tax=Anaeromicrobium sediminis TaxID=1478221 RepID=A0A267ML18_9FIRM|nr:AbrB family transcriptional regulator [Anaeromicrobium sediminis]PAB60226.1 AbrB family transcriptional regulator [Anaeromicrobium sediminis]
MDKIIYTLFIASIGGFVGLKLKIPAGALIGAMFAVAIYNIYTGQGHMPKSFKIGTQIVVGAMIGLNFTMEAVSELKKLAIPALILVAALTIFCICLGIIISKIAGIDLVTAMFSCAPGGLTDMALICEPYGAEVPTVVSLHLMRLITVIAILPSVIKLLSSYIRV